MIKNRVAVAISGGGRTLANLIDQQSRYEYEVVAVISSSKDCLGLSIAEQHGLPVFVGSFQKDQFPETKESLGLWLDEHKIHWIALGGFLKMFPTFPAYHGKTVNIHPALLPKFGGKGMYGSRVHQAVLSAGEKLSGATIHYVSEQYDEGQIIAQKDVDISDCHSADEIAKRVFHVECALYPRVLDQLIRDEQRKE